MSGDERISYWHELNPFERTVAAFTFDCRDRIKSFQHPLAREFIIPPVVLRPETEDRRLFQLELFFPCRSVIPSNDNKMDSITFSLFQNPETPFEAEIQFECFHGDRELEDGPVSDFGGIIRQDMMEWDVKRRSMLVPSAKIKSELTTIDERDVMVDAEDWFDSCLWLAAACPRKMTRPNVMDVLNPPEQALVPTT